jgi:hypothetical protein
MTKEETLEQIKKVERIRCRGPLSEEDLKLKIQILRHRNKDAVESVRQQLLDKARERPKSFDYMKAQIEGYTPMQIAVLVDSRRQRCGVDLTPLITVDMLDGELHKYNCPGCGLPHTYRYVLNEVLEGAVVEDSG